MNKLYFEGQQTWRGQKLMAALDHVDGGFTKKGSRRLPRAWRVLPGVLSIQPRRALQALGQPPTALLGEAAVDMGESCH